MIRSRIFLVLLALLPLFLTSCDEDQPGWVMSEEEMVPVIKDLHLAYSGVDITIRDPKQRPEKYQEMNAVVIEKHGVDRENFYDSYEYYQSQPALMDSLYQKVIDQLNQELTAKSPQGPRNPVPNRNPEVK